MSQVFETQVELVTHVCIECGTVFALNWTMERQRRLNHQTFYCPNGHQMAYRAQTEAEKWKEKADQHLTTIYRRENDIAALENSNRALRAQITKLKKRGK